MKLALKIAAYLIFGVVVFYNTPLILGVLFAII